MSTWVCDNLTRVSPSQINTYLLCARRWGWDKITGFREPTTPAQQFGTDTHTELENLYTKKVTPNQLTAPGRLAAKGLHLIPTMNDPTAKVEGKFHFDIDGIRYNGIKDLTYEDGHHKLNVIHDHKTTSSPDWVKTPEDLQQDPQAIMYAYDYFWRYSEHNQVIMRWLYLFTKGNRDPLIVEVIFDRAFVVNQFEAIVVPVAKLIQYAKQNITDPLDLPYRPQACSAFGKPCPNLDRCNLSVTERCLAHMSEKKSPKALLAELIAATDKAPGPAVLGVAPPPVEHTAGLYDDVVQIHTTEPPAINPPPTPPAINPPPTPIGMASGVPAVSLITGMPPPPMAAAPGPPPVDPIDHRGSGAIAPHAIDPPKHVQVRVESGAPLPPPEAPPLPPEEVPPPPTVEARAKPLAPMPGTERKRRRRRTRKEMEEARDAAPSAEVVPLEEPDEPEAVLEAAQDNIQKLTDAILTLNETVDTLLGKFV